jgi:FAD/FMN-containing dehydrogenase
MKSFNPPIRTLMGPGPSDVHPRILSAVYRQKPLAVVLPQSVEQIKQVLKICKAHNTPVVTRGAGTGLSGGAMPLEESVVLGLSKLNRIKSTTLWGNTTAKGFCRYTLKPSHSNGRVFSSPVRTLPLGRVRDNS